MPFHIDPPLQLIPETGQEGIVIEATTVEDIGVTAVDGPVEGPEVAVIEAEMQ